MIKLQEWLENKTTKPILLDPKSAINKERYEKRWEYKTS